MHSSFASGVVRVVSRDRDHSIALPRFNDVQTVSRIYLFTSYTVTTTVLVSHTYHFTTVHLSNIYHLINFYLLHAFHFTVLFVRSTLTTLPSFVYRNPSTSA